MLNRWMLSGNTSKQKNSYIWNSIGGLFNAFQSVIILMVLTRTVGILDAGIFTIAYAIANLMLTIGKYGVRNFQVTDVNKRFNFNEYHTSRVISTSLMLVVSVIYVAYSGYQNSYDINKMLVVMCMCILKTVDSIEDVYHGYYQQCGRLDVSGKCLTLRLLLTLIVYLTLLFVTKNLLISTMISTVFTFIVYIYFKKITFSYFTEEKLQLEFNGGKEILFICFPLFLANFLSFYIINAPKYSIDIILSGELQAIYGFISMPVFVIGLLNGFIYQPQLTILANIYGDRVYKKFNKIIFKQIIILFALSLFVLLCGYILGIPVLSVLYNTELDIYKTEFLILLVGGGFLGLSGFLMSVLTLMREQKLVLYGYIITAIVAFILSPFTVERYKLLGAATTYTVLSILLAFIFLIVYLIKMKNNQDE